MGDLTLGNNKGSTITVPSKPDPVDIDDIDR